MDELNYPFMRRLQKDGLITLKELYIDGTKIQQRVKDNYRIADGRWAGGIAPKAREIQKVEVLNRIVSILVGLVTLAEKSKPYIKRHKAETEKDPSVCLAAPDGSDDDCLGNR